jgi:hypothetical protein
MRLFRVLSLCFLWLSMTAAPSFAAAYAWPMTISQPVNITNLSLPTSSVLMLWCYIGAKGAIAPFSVGAVSLPSSVAPGGGVSFSGTATVTVNPAAGVSNVPVAGNVASCGLKERAGTVLTDIGNGSTLTLP